MKEIVTNLRHKGNFRKSKFFIINQIKAYINSIDKSKDSYISRNQACIIENQLFNIIYGGLYNFVYEDNFYIITGYDFEFENISNYSINKKNLKSFLVNEIQILQTVNKPTLLNLKDYLSGLEKRIVRKYIKP